MKKIVSTLNLSREEWLKYRKKGICGTDAGVITGFNPYISAFSVYRDKTSDEISEFDNEAMRQGRDMEDYVARRFMEETGKQVRRANAIYKNEKHPIMLADFDRLIVGEKAGLECKTVSPYSADKWSDGKIPMHYHMQVQHYLAVSGYECWYIAALIFGRDFIIRKIERDEELINNLTVIEENWWEKHIVENTIPEPDGSTAYTKLLNEYYHSDRDKTVKLYGMDKTLERRGEIDSLIKKLNTEKEAIDQRIKINLEDASYGETEKYKVSWIDTVQNRIDSKKLKAENPDIYNGYLNEVHSKRFTVKKIA
ncbi:YqaJ viral recombinase family nuclease [Eubacterium sp.]